jgi:hypothetical protein
MSVSEIIEIVSNFFDIGDRSDIDIIAAVNASYKNMTLPDLYLYNVHGSPMSKKLDTISIISETDITEF